MATTSKNTTKTVSPSGINYEGYEESKSGGGTFANLAGLGISKHKAISLEQRAELFSGDDAYCVTATAPPPPSCGPRRRHE